MSKSLWQIPCFTNSDMLNPKGRAVLSASLSGQSSQSWFLDPSYYKRKQEPFWVCNTNSRGIWIPVKLQTGRSLETLDFKGLWHMAFPIQWKQLWHWSWLSHWHIRVVRRSTKTLSPSDWPIGINYGVLFWQIIYVGGPAPLWVVASLGRWALVA